MKKYHKAFLFIVTTILSLINCELYAQNAFQSNGTNLIYMGGNVGIGTNSPSYKLDVEGSMRLNGSMSIPGGANASVLGMSVDGPYLHLFGNNAGNTDQAGGAHFISNSSVNSLASFMVWDLNNSVYTKRLVLRSKTGFLGVNTGDPQQNLHVEGSTAVTGTLIIGDPRLEESANQNLSIFFDKTSNVGVLNSGHWGNTWRSILINPTSTIESFGLGIGISTSPDSRLQVKGAGTTSQSSVFHAVNQASATLFRIRDDGSVGIGTANPQAKLSVNGDIFTHKIKVTQEGWADHVFADSYNRVSLDSLRVYVKRHSHLPEVPSAEEVTRDGLNLGDNQVLLLKKIEELTLYILDIHEELKKQKSEMEALKSQIISNRTDTN